MAIKQGDHAHLAATFAESWGNSRAFRPEPWQPVVLATRRHDDGWLEWDGAPTLDDRGRPLDFLTIPVADRLEIYRRGIEMVASEDLHAGLLTSLHLTGLLVGGYEPGTPAALDSFGARDRPITEQFLAEQERWRARIREKMGELSQLHDQYRLVKFCDFLSLTLCMTPPSEPRPHHFPFVPLAPGKALSTLDLKPGVDGHLALNPYPFTQPTLGAEVAARRLPSTSFESETAYRRALENAPIEKLRFVLSPT
ncbi:MAG: DUF3891 family protein [Actinomycetota bacterium]